MSLDLLIIAAGAFYGYVRPGREDKWKILKKGLKIGLILGVALGLIGVLVGGGFVAIAKGTVGIVAFVLIAFVISIEFIIGTFIGDSLEHKFKK